MSPRELVFKDVALRGFWLAKWFRTTTPPQQYTLLTELAGLIAAGTLSTPIQATYDVAQIKEAVAAAAAGERQGKILVTPAQHELQSRAVALWVASTRRRRYLPVHFPQGDHEEKASANLADDATGIPGGGGISDPDDSRRACAGLS